MIADETGPNPNGQDGRYALREETEARPRGLRGAALLRDTRSRPGRTAGAGPDRLRFLVAPVATACAIDGPSRLAEAVREALSEGHDPIVRGDGLGYPERVHERDRGLLKDDAEPSIAQNLRKRGTA